MKLTNFKVPISLAQAAIKHIQTELIKQHRKEKKTIYCMTADTVTWESQLEALREIVREGGK